MLEIAEEWVWLEPIVDCMEDGKRDRECQIGNRSVGNT